MGDSFSGWLDEKVLIVGNISVNWVVLRAVIDFLYYTCKELFLVYGDRDNDMLEKKKQCI